jgi:tripartite-type tricarboxylate transporter receptor subunit TctC
MRRMRTAFALLLALLATCVGVEAAAQSWPLRPIRLVAPFTPAGGADVMSRIIVQALSEQLGQQVVVDNRGGAGGRIAMELVAKSPADGYTLILGNVSTFAILPASGIKLPFDPRRDFQPVSLLATSDYILTVSPTLPVHTVNDVLALARAKPGTLTFGSAGTVTGPHLCGELLKMYAKVDIVHVPYKGNGPAVVALMAGEITMLFGRGSVVAHLETGKLRGIATTGPTRSIPSLPTMAETLPGFDVTQWYGIFAPAGTPKDTIARLQKEIAVAIAKPKVAQTYMNAQVEPASSTPEQLAALVAAETAKYVKVVKAAGLKAE